MTISPQNKISDNNNAVLLKMANTLYENLTQTQKETVSEQFRLIVSEGWKPITGKDAGSMIGRAVAEAKSDAIVRVFTRVFGETMTIVPAVKMAVGTIGVTAGSIAIPAALLASNLVYSKILGKNTKPTSYKLPTIEISKLVLKNAENKYIDCLGHELADEDVKEIRDGIIKYNLMVKLIGSPKERVESLMQESIILRADGKFIAEDGSELTPEDQKALEDGANRLKRENPMREKKQIKAYVEKLTSFSQFTVEHAYDKLLVKSKSDGIYCTREDNVVEGKSRGYIPSEEELEFLMSVSKKQAEFVTEFLGKMIDIAPDLKTATLKDGTPLSQAELNTVLNVARELKLVHPAKFNEEFDKFRQVIDTLGWQQIKPVAAKSK